jgi:hypothetical protein
MAEAEQALDEQSTEVDPTEIDPSIEETEGAEQVAEEEEFEIVLASEEEAEKKPETRDTKDHILNRVMRKKEKLQDEVVTLRAQLEQRAQPVASAAVQSAPDEYDEKYGGDRQLYLQDYSIWQRQMMADVTTQQLNEQQNGHRIAARQQEEDAALTTYAESASKLKVKDYNSMQDKAFDVLGDKFAQMLARQLPEKAPMLMCHFAANPQSAAKYREDFERNPGLTTFNLGELSNGLKLKPKSRKAADPESKTDTGSVVGSGTDWQAKLDKIDDEADLSNIAKALNARQDLKKEAKAAGYDVSKLK